MKAAVVTTPGQIEIQEIPDPTCKDYDVIVEMLAGGVCGSDTKILHGHFPGIENYPLVLGHEGVGRVVDKGKKVKSFEIGDLVIRPGLEQTGVECLDSGWGAFAQYGVATDWKALQGDGILDFNPLYYSQQSIPSDMDPVLATMLITFKETLHALKIFGIDYNTSVVITGDGAVGLSLVQFAKLLGANPVIICGHHEERLKLAKELGADYALNTKGQDIIEAIRQVAKDGVDLFVEAAGVNDIVHRAPGVLKLHGKLAIYGIAADPVFSVQTKDAPAHWKLEHFPFPDFPLEAATHEFVLDLIKRKVIDPAKFVTHRFPLENINGAFEAIARREALKAVITF